MVTEPQSCALAVGAAEERVLINEDPDTSDAEPYVTAHMMTATLSCDHRTIDGAVGAQWMQTFKAYMEKPVTMLL